MAFTKKQVHYTLIAGGILVTGVVLYKLLSGGQSATAAAVKNQQLAAAKSAAGTSATVPSLSMPVAPTTLVNTDTNDPANIQISATSAPSNPTFGGVAIV